jgi:hypothetical protein
MASKAATRSPSPHVAAIQRSTRTVSSLSHREQPPRHHRCACLEPLLLPWAARREGEGGVAKDTRPPGLPTQPPKLQPSHHLHQPAATERDRYIDHRQIRRRGGGRGSSRGLMAFQAAQTRSTRHTAFAIQLPPSATVKPSSRCNRMGQTEEGGAAEAKWCASQAAIPPAMPPPPPHVQPQARARVDGYRH